MSRSLLFAKAISDDTRQSIMKILCCEWLTVNDVVEQLGGSVTQPTVSHHLKILNDAGLLHRRKEGRQVICTLNQEMVNLCCGELITTFAPELVPADTIPLAEITTT